MTQPALAPTLSAEGKEKLLARLVRILAHPTSGGTIVDLFDWLQRNIGLAANDAQIVASVASDLGIPDQALLRRHLVELYHALGGDPLLI